MNKETLRMQMLSGVITEGEYKAKLEENKESLNEHYVAGGIVGVGAINQIPSREKSDYEMAFDYFLKNEKNTLKETKIEGGIEPVVTLIGKDPNVDQGKLRSALNKVTKDMETKDLTPEEKVALGDAFLWALKGGDLTMLKSKVKNIKTSNDDAGGENLEEVAAFSSPFTNVTKVIKKDSKWSDPKEDDDFKFYSGEKFMVGDTVKITKKGYEDNPRKIEAIGLKDDGTIMLKVKDETKNAISDFSPEELTKL